MLNSEYRCADVPVVAPVCLAVVHAGVQFVQVAIEDAATTTEANHVFPRLQVVADDEAHSLHGFLRRLLLLGADLEGVGVGLPRFTVASVVEQLLDVLVVDGEDNAPWDTP